MPVEVRRALPSDAGVLMPMICEHAAYEQEVATCTETALRSALSGNPPVIRAWLAEQAGEAVGYATATLDFSTWSGRTYLHLDCLFIDPAHRSEGIGARLLGAARAHAISESIEELQWQTPVWNERAARFYIREGATASPKVRFRLNV